MSCALHTVLAVKRQTSAAKNNFVRFIVVEFLIVNILFFCSFCLRFFLLTLQRYTHVQVRNKKNGIFMIALLRQPPAIATPAKTRYKSVASTSLFDRIRAYIEKLLYFCYYIFMLCGLSAKYVACLFTNPNYQPEGSL